MSGHFFQESLFTFSATKIPPPPHIKEAEKIATVAKSGVNGPKYVVSHQH